MTDVSSAYQALLQGAAFFDLGAWGRLRFTGPDARAYLNGLLTNDVARLAPRHGFPVCLLTPKGKAQAEFLLYAGDDSLLALVRPEAAANLKAGLGKMIMLSETKLADEAAATALFLVSGPGAPKAAALLGGVWPKDHAWASARFEGEGVELCSYPRFQENAAFIVAPAVRAAALRAALEKAGVAAGDDAALETWRIERGIPAFGRDLDAETIPLEARLEEAISFTKGCYMGQETISRIHHLGHVNRILAAVALSGEAVPSAGAEVAEHGTSVGKVTSACFSPKFKRPLALAMVRRESAKPGTSLTIAGAGGEVVDLGAWPS